MLSFICGLLKKELGGPLYPKVYMDVIDYPFRNPCVGLANISQAFVLIQ